MFSLITIVSRLLLRTYYLPNPDQKFSVLLAAHEAANRLHIHLHYLSDRLKKYTGKTALQHIRGRMAFEAQHLIWNRNITVAEIGSDAPVVS